MIHTANIIFKNKMAEQNNKKMKQGGNWMGILKGDIGSLFYTETLYNNKKRSGINFPKRFSFMIQETIIL